jgi:hypothetical protein
MKRPAVDTGREERSALEDKQTTARNVQSIRNGMQGKQHAMFEPVRGK